MSLSRKRARFAEEYIVDLNATRAAVRAGYSPSNAASQGVRLLADPATAAAIEAALAARSERLKVDAAWVLQRLVDEAEADLADLYDEAGALKPVDQWPAIWRRGLVAGLDVEEVREEGAVVGVVRKLRLSDRIRRLELIGKHVGVQAFREQVGLSAPDGGPIRFKAEEMSDDDLAAIAAQRGA